ncbi:hypothetical protein B0H34DRAFT_730011 [Crassisporium funariophilum]|nr:hypothetical protein B0H34DRAFT_730011 [Crassisporium funariophilum]
MTHSRDVPAHILDMLSHTSRSCINNLVRYFASMEPTDLSSQPQSKLAAVLVLLYEQDGDLRALLTTRSKQLRTHPGQTALPGGKKDQTDTDLIMTAYREANEEVGLPIDNSSIYTLGLLEPFISLHKLVVTPVVSFLTEPDIVKNLKAAEGEVSHIFSHRLEAILDPNLAKRGPLVSIGSEDWPYDSDVYNTSDSNVPMLGNMTYRMHRFRTSASPIKGLSADILIKIAEIAFAKSTTYDRDALGQLRSFADLLGALTNHESKNPVAV